MIIALEELIDGSDQLSATKRAELRGRISTMPGLNRFLRVTPGGLLRTDKAKAKAEENLDGKYLLRSADPQMTAEDIAAGYKQLLEVERSWRDMKSVLDLRPVYHRSSGRRFDGPAGTFSQRTDIPKTARNLLNTLKIDVPRKIHELTTPQS